MNLKENNFYMTTKNIENAINAASSDDYLTFKKEFSSALTDILKEKTSKLENRVTKNIFKE